MGVYCDNSTNMFAYHRGCVGLVAAIHIGRGEVVQQLLEKGASAQPKPRSTPPHMKRGIRWDSVTGALAPERVTMRGKAALHLAAEKGHQAIVVLLLEDGANMDAVDED